MLENWRSVARNAAGFSGHAQLLLLLRAAHTAVEIAAVVATQASQSLAVHIISAGSGVYIQFERGDSTRPGASVREEACEVWGTHATLSSSPALAPKCPQRG